MNKERIIVLATLIFCLFLGKLIADDGGAIPIGQGGTGTTTGGGVNQLLQSTGPSSPPIYVSSPTLAGIIASSTTFNGVPYQWPLTQGGASTTLNNDGSGNLTWAAAAGGGGSVVPIINTAAQTDVAYYSVSGSSNTLSGSASFTFAPMAGQNTTTTIAAGAPTGNSWTNTLKLTAQANSAPVNILNLNAFGGSNNGSNQVNLAGTSGGGVQFYAGDNTTNYWQGPWLRASSHDMIFASVGGGIFNLYLNYADNGAGFGLSAAPAANIFEVGSGETTQFDAVTVAQALCLTAGHQLGHCTTVVGAGGGCTCSVN